MPRKGKGQKIQTATGQEYGQAQAQEEAQREIPLPEMAPANAIAPGSMGSLLRPSEKPDQPVTAMPESMPTQPAEPPFSEKMARILPALLPLANSPYVGDDTRQIVNKMIAMVPQKDAK
tara:strand:+ start:925 stop:1281 length:357 start_codon:yes stop_codon:yes gene_type:complete